MSDLGSLLPILPHPPPGPASGALAERLRAVESRNVTWLDGAFATPWAEARGGNVRDADGNVFVDLTAAFGVALAGHAHPSVVEAVQRQADRLLHGMGDVHPPAVKVELLERLAALAPWTSSRGVLASTGSEAVEIALKTALLATGRPGILAFSGGYHGLTLGALSSTERDDFRRPFLPRLFGGVAWAPFPDGATLERSLAETERLLREGAPGGTPIGAVIIEPVQGRAGIRIPPAGFGAELSRLARAHDALLIADEVLTGIGRCGRPLASDRLGFGPDLICLGKALGGGLPMSICLGRREVMDAWPTSEGEALHTSTFLGHPLGCAAALAILDLLDGGLDAQAEETGSALLKQLSARLQEVESVADVRGIGAALGIELADPGEGQGVRVARAALQRGLIVLPAGDRGQVVELTPPACLTSEQVEFAADALADAVRKPVPA